MQRSGGNRKEEERRRRREEEEKRRRMASGHLATISLAKWQRREAVKMDWTADCRTGSLETHTNFTFFQSGLKEVQNIVFIKGA
jgi:hypothetical protein